MWGRYLISMAGCIFDPAQPDQLKINTKRGKKREGKERERKEEKGRGRRGLVHFIFTSLLLVILSHSLHSIHNFSEPLLGFFLGLALFLLLLYLLVRGSIVFISAIRTISSHARLVHPPTLHSKATLGG